MTASPRLPNLIQLWFKLSRARLSPEVNLLLFLAVKQHQQWPSLTNLEAIPCNPILLILQVLALSEFFFSLLFIYCRACLCTFSILVILLEMRLTLWWIPSTRVVTLCTVGYRDITPTSAATKLFSIVYVLVGVGFISLLLGVMLNHLLDLHDDQFLKSTKWSYGKSSYVLKREVRLKIKTNMILSLLVVFVFIVVGVLFIHYVESLGWLDSLNHAVISVITVGYGDQAFKSVCGRLFGSIWLLLCTLAVCRAFLYLAELIVDKRNREMTRRNLDHNLSVPQFLDTDLDQSGSYSERKSKFILHKLKEMGKLSEEDIRLVGKKFDRRVTANLRRANN